MALLPLVLNLDMGEGIFTFGVLALVRDILVIFFLYLACMGTPMLIALGLEKCLKCTSEEKTCDRT